MGGWGVNRDRIDQAEQQLEQLSALSARLDPVPPAAFEAALAAFSWRTIDAELADLVFDSSSNQGEVVGIRSGRASRYLTFEAPHLAIELELDDDADYPVVGQLVPVGPAQVEACFAGSALAVQADERGRFWIPAVSGRVMSLRITRPGGIDCVATPWVSLVAATT
jgi:hypothetical protein